MNSSVKQQHKNTTFRCSWFSAGMLAVIQSAEWKRNRRAEKSTEHWLRHRAAWWSVWFWDIYTVTGLSGINAWITIILQAEIQSIKAVSEEWTVPCFVKVQLKICSHQLIASIKNVWKLDRIVPLFRLSFKCSGSLRNVLNLEIKAVFSMQITLNEW